MTPGVQAIELQGTAPKLKMQVAPGTRRLFVSATGDFFDSGGIEMIDLDSLQSIGYAAGEAEDQLGADLGPFAMVTSDAGYLAFSTDLAISTHMLPFSVTGGVEHGPAVYEDIGYFAPVIRFDELSDNFFVPQGSMDFGIHVFDATTGTRQTTDAVALGGPPADMTLLCSGFGDCAVGGPVPAASTWGLVALALLVIATGTLACLGVIQERSRRSTSGNSAARSC